MAMGTRPVLPIFVGRWWKEHGDRVQLGMQMAHVNCATAEPALTDCRSLGSALGTFSTLPSALSSLSAPTPHTHKGVNCGLRSR